MPPLSSIQSLEFTFRRRVRYRGCFGLRPLKSTIGREPRLAQLVERETQRLQRCGHALLADLLAGLGGRLVAPDDLPSGRTVSAATRSSVPRNFLRLADTWPAGRRAHRRLQRDVDHLAGKTLEILFVAQRPVDAGRGHLEPLVLGALDLERELQLARDLFAVFDRDEGLWRPGSRIFQSGGRPGQINRDAQQSSGRALDLDQVIAETGHGLFHYLLQCHVSLVRLLNSHDHADPPALGIARPHRECIDQKKRAVGTRPFGREPRIICQMRYINEGLRGFAHAIGLGASCHQTNANSTAAERQ